MIEQRKCGLSVSPIQRVILCSRCLNSAILLGACPPYCTAKNKDHLYRTAKAAIPGPSAGRFTARLGSDIDEIPGDRGLHSCRSRRLYALPGPQCNRCSNGRRARFSANADGEGEASQEGRAAGAELHNLLLVQGPGRIVALQRVPGEDHPHRRRQGTPASLRKASTSACRFSPDTTLMATSARRSPAKARRSARSTFRKGRAPISRSSRKTTRDFCIRCYRSR